MAAASGDDELPEQPPALAPFLAGARQLSAASSEAEGAAAGDAPAETPPEAREGRGESRREARLLKRKLSDGTKEVNGLRVLSTLGVGAYGKVKLAEDVATGARVAIKQLSRLKLRRKREVEAGPDGALRNITALERVEREVSIMMRLRHPHVLQLLRVVDDPSAPKLYLVLEFAELGELLRWDADTLRFESRVFAPAEADAPGMNESDARRCFAQLLDAVAYLHEQRVAHRDIKPANVLVSASRTLKLGDFGAALEVPRGASELVDSTVGTFAFQCPEACAGARFNVFAADLWALGVVLHAMLFGRLPWTAPTDPQLFALIRAARLELPDAPRVSHAARSLVQRMLASDAAQRPSLAELRAHEWLRA